MFRRLPAFFLVTAALLALTLAAEPLHNHPLFGSGSSASACAVCAAVAHHVPKLGSAVVAPHRVIAILAAPETTRATRTASIPLPSRAPPAAA
jgi:hypothetical protein